MEGIMYQAACTLHQDGCCLTLWQWVLIHNFFRRSTGSLHIANQDGRTPLMVASSKGRHNIAKQLLAAGAFVNLQVFSE